MEPLGLLPLAWFYLLAGIAEVCVAIVLVRHGGTKIGLITLSSLVLAILIYRLAMYVQGRSTCPCLGEIATIFPGLKTYQASLANLGIGVLLATVVVDFLKRCVARSRRVPEQRTADFVP